MDLIKKNFSNFCCLKIKSNVNDKLSNLIMGVKAIRANQMGINKTSQLYLKGNDSLFTYLKVDFNQEKDEFLSILNNLTKVKINFILD